MTIGHRRLISAREPMCGMLVYSIYIYLLVSFTLNMGKCSSNVWSGISDLFLPSSFHGTGVLRNYQFYQLVDFISNVVLAGIIQPL